MAGFIKPSTMAFVLINVEAGAESDVLKDLIKIDGVKEAYVVYGIYDVVAKIEAENLDRLKEIITWHIRRLARVKATQTMIVIEGAKK